MKEWDTGVFVGMLGFLSSGSCAGHVCAVSLWQPIELRTCYVCIFSECVLYFPPKEESVVFSLSASYIIKKFSGTMENIYGML